MLNKLNIKSRLILIIALLSLVAVGVGVIGLLGMSQTKEGLREVYESRMVPIDHLADIQKLMVTSRLRLTTTLLNPTPAQIKKNTNIVERNFKEIHSGLDTYIAEIFDPEEKVLADKLIADLQQFEVEALAPTIEAMRANDIALAQQLMDEKLRPLYEPPADDMQSLFSLQLNMGKQEYENAVSLYERTRIISITAIVLGLMLAGFMGALLIRGICRSLGAAQQVANAIADGDFSSKIEVNQNDEIAKVLQSMTRMQDSINGFVAAQGVMAQKHAEGWISEQIDDARFKGTYGKMAREINELVNSHIAVKMKVVEVISQYAKGDFSRDMDRLPGEKAKITAAMDSVKQALLSFSSQVKMLAEAGANGDFSKRGEAEQFEFMFRDMLTDMNTLIETCDTGFNDVMRVAGALAEGDLTQTITKDYPGVFGQTRDAMNETISNLKNLIDEIKLSVDTIGTASQEIASGNTDLSQRTEEQASSLEETAASMEELTSTVKQNAENARQANQLAHGASEVAEKGGAVVQKVVGTMSSINESSRKIVDIISVIDGIAFQTNILALNAAVEAARAGEQGRGFAVVASEVRSLAQRSAAAAKEIKTLIGDSVEKVEVGSKLVNEAGETMGDIVTSIQLVTNIVGEIAAASSEQSVGIEQVNQSVTQMDDVTQQNAALVEEAAAAAESLEQEAQSLIRSVSVFKLDSAMHTQHKRLELVPQTPPAKKNSTVVELMQKNEVTARPAGKPVRKVKASSTNDEGVWEEF